MLSLKKHIASFRVYNDKLGLNDMAITNTYFEELVSDVINASSVNFKYTLIHNNASMIREENLHMCYFYMAGSIYDLES